MSYKEKHDWSTYSDPDTAMGVYGNTIRKGLSGDGYNAKTHFKAIALSDMFPLSANQYMAIDGGSTGGADNTARRYAFKARIIGENSPHSFLPDPCDPSFSSDNAGIYKVIAMHTTFISSEMNSGDNVTRGDVVVVELNKTGFSYDLKYGRFISISSVESPSSEAGTTCASLVSLVGEWGGPPPGGGNQSIGAGMAGSTPGNYSGAGACKDTTPAPDDWMENALWLVVANSGKSKNYTDVLPLDGGSIGIAHYAAGGLEGFVEAMGEAQAQKHFGRSIAEVLAFQRSRKNGKCTGNTPSGKNDNGTGCYAVDWWKQGMTSFVQDPESKAIQTKLWFESKGKKSSAAAKSNGWTTARQFTIASGIANSLGTGGFKKLAGENGWDAEKTLTAYARLSAHKTRRANLINKHFPCGGGAGTDGALAGHTQDPANAEEFNDSNLGTAWVWVDKGAGTWRTLPDGEVQQA